MAEQSERQNRMVYKNTGKAKMLAGIVGVDFVCLQQRIRNLCKD